MRFYLRYTDVIDHPQILRAGFWAAQVFTALCDVCAARDFGGFIPHDYLTARWLVRTMNLLPEDVPNGDPEQTVIEALSRLSVTGLLVVTEGGMRIDGWDRRQPKAPMSDAERKRKQRERQDMSRNVTAVRDSHECHAIRGEEKREEEKKEKETDPRAQGALVLSAESEARPEPPDRIHGRWRELWSPRADPRLDRKRRKRIQALLRERSERQILDSLEGWKNDPWPERPRNAKLEQLLRDAGQVDKGLELLAQGPPRRPQASSPEAHVGRAREPERIPCPVAGCPNAAATELLGTDSCACPQHAGPWNLAFHGNRITAAELQPYLAGKEIPNAHGP